MGIPLFDIPPHILLRDVFLTFEESIFHIVWATQILWLITLVPCGAWMRATSNRSKIKDVVAGDNGVRWVIGSRMSDGSCMTSNTES